MFLFVVDLGYRTFERARFVIYFVYSFFVFFRLLLAIVSGVINKLCCGKCICNVGNCLRNSFVTFGCI